MSQFDSRKKLLVVFDIDETLIQFIPNAYFNIWEKSKSKFNPDMYIEKEQSTGKKVVIIFRPHLKELFELFKSNNFYKPALWTYSERSYCNMIASVLEEKYDLPEDFFLLKYGAEDIDEDIGIPKNLEVIYEKYPTEFNTFNTILIDDRYGNINNESNIKNGLVIQPFAPFGAEKKREVLSSRKLKEQLSDNVMKSVIDIMQKIRKDIEGCESEDIDDGFNTESVFNEKRINRMELNDYYKTFAVKFIDTISVGVPYLTSKFILIEDYKNYPKKMGGNSKTAKKNRQKRQKKNNATKRRRH
jgi:hypothetical protein